MILDQYDVNATNPSLDQHRIALLADALARVLVKVGVLRDDVSLTGPELLVVADSFLEGC